MFLVFPCLTVAKSLQSVKYINTLFRGGSLALLLLAGLLSSLAFASQDVCEHQVFYRAVQVEGLSIFYREAGPKDAPTILLLHGFPSSSHV